MLQVRLGRNPELARLPDHGLFGENDVAQISSLLSTGVCRSAARRPLVGECQHIGCRIALAIGAIELAYECITAERDRGRSPRGQAAGDVARQRGGRTAEISLKVSESTPVAAFAVDGKAYSPHRL